MVCGGGFNLTTITLAHFLRTNVLRLCLDKPERQEILHWFYQRPEKKAKRAQFREEYQHKIKVAVKADFGCFTVSARNSCQ